MFDDENAAQESAPQSMDDTLSAAFDALSDDNEPESADNESSAPTRERDDQGRFASKKSAEETVDADAVVEDAVADDESVAEEKQPPSSWRANVREQFATLAPEVQDEILRREADFHKGLEQYRSDADYGRNLKQVLAPYQQDFAALGVDESRAVGTLLGYERTLRLGSPEQKLEIFQSMASSYGVPVEALLSDDGEVQQAAMLNAQLTSRLNQLEQRLHGFTSQQQSQVQAQADDAVAKFASDPANKWFNDVASDMLKLIKSEITADIKEAYDMACNMRPDIRAAMAAQQQREADEKRQKEAAQRMAQAKKAASVNVRQGGPKPVASNAPRTIDQTLSEVFDRLQAS